MIRNILCLILIALVIASCSPGVQLKTVEATETSQVLLLPSSPPAALEPVSPNSPNATKVVDVQVPPNEEPTSFPAQAANCATAEANKLGAAIAKDYDFTSTEQVMTWFCDGAEFEDILTALETADQTGASVEEMLVMLAAGLSWEEIWQAVSLTD